MPIYDISRRIAPDTAVWPGDAPFSFDMAVSRSDGNSINLTTVHLSPHTGTHADAGFHFADDGAFPDQMPLENYIGAAQVVTVTREHGAITPDDVSDAISGQVERLLIHTWVSDLADDQWPEDFPYPGVELIDWLADRGAVLLGMDSPSVDDFNSKDLAGHNRLRNHGMGHLELLQLKDVPDGAYELIALPLKLSGVCGSPVRAILRQ